MNNGIIRISKDSIDIKIALISYALLVNCLFIYFFKDVFKNSYNGMLYVFDFSLLKYIFCIFETIIVLLFVNKKIELNNLSDVTMIIVDLFYFIPGFVYFSVINVTWKYIIIYFSFWTFMQIWNFVLPHPTSSFISYRKPFSTETYTLVLSIVCICITCFIVIYTGTNFSLTNIIYSLNNVYDVRSLAKEKNTYWVFKTLQYWAVYFMLVAITYYVEKKKYYFCVLLVVCEIAMFLIQANRIFLFLTFCAVLIGLINVNNKKLLFFSIGIVSFIVVEQLCFIDGHSSLTIDIFRRLSIVPNFNGTLYSDFVKNHSPNYLRTNYPRIIEMLGISSPYKNLNLPSTVGKYYYGYSINANTGLVGGSVGEYGNWLAIVLGSFGYVATYKLFEKALFELKNQRIVFLVSIVLATLSINVSGLLSCVFSLQYEMLVFVSLLLFGNSKSEENKIGCVIDE